MKDIRFNISLYIIIPVIFAGIAILSIIVTYNTTSFYFSRNLDPERAAVPELDTVLVPEVQDLVLLINGAKGMVQTTGPVRRTPRANLSDQAFHQIAQKETKRKTSKSKAAVVSEEIPFDEDFSDF